MEVRKKNINFNRSGSGSYTPRIAFPIKHLRKLGITPENREVNYYFDEENEIMIVSKKDLKNSKIKIV